MDLRALVHLAALLGVDVELRAYATTIASGGSIDTQTSPDDNLNRDTLGRAWLLIYAWEVSGVGAMTRLVWHDQTRIKDVQTIAHAGSTYFHTQHGGSVPILKLYGPGDPQRPDIFVANNGPNQINFALLLAYFSQEGWRDFLKLVDRLVRGGKGEGKLDAILEELRCARERLDVIAAAGAQETRVVVR